MTIYIGSPIIVESDLEDAPLGNMSEEVCVSDNRGLEGRDPQFSALRDKTWLDKLNSASPLPADVKEPENLSSSDQARLDLSCKNVLRIPKWSRGSFEILTEDLEESTTVVEGWGVSAEDRERLLQINNQISEHLFAGIELEDKLKGINSQISDHRRVGLKLEAALSAAFKRIGDVPL